MASLEARTVAQHSSPGEQGLLFGGSLRRVLHGVDTIVRPARCWLEGLSAVAAWIFNHRFQLRQVVRLLVPPLKPHHRFSASKSPATHLTLPLLLVVGFHQWSSKSPTAHLTLPLLQAVGFHRWSLVPQAFECKQKWGLCIRPARRSNQARWRRASSPAPGGGSILPGTKAVAAHLLPAPRRQPSSLRRRSGGGVPPSPAEKAEVPPLHGQATTPLHDASQLWCSAALVIASCGKGQGKSAHAVRRARRRSPNDHAAVPFPASQVTLPL
ncbi:hypothetical protein U9M48_001498 [Paspalum notatum var. saurae]|uniref:Uncharacterized protein n=1 Tax=Paspalum notatum var. saurae TaxID=547442 RepID=A0AAQ3PPJ1_PASNO